MLRERMLAEGKNLVRGDDVFAVGKCVEMNLRRLLLAALIADQKHDLADSLRLSLEYSLHLPGAAVVVTPTGLHEGVDGFLRGCCGREACRVRLGKHGRRGGSRRGRNLLLGSGLEKGQSQSS